MLTSKLRPELQGLSQSGGHVRRPFAGDQPQTGLRPPRRGARPLAATPGSVPRVHGRIQRPRSCSPRSRAWVWKLGALFREATCSWELHSGQS